MKATPFDPETGRFGFALEGDAEFIAENTPPGWSWAPGHHNAELQRFERFVVDDFGAVVPVVVSQRPDAPEDDEWSTWSWDAAALRWVSQWTLKSRDILKRRERDQILASTDWVKQRADERGEPLPPEWLAWRQALRDAPADPAWPDIDFPPPPTP